MSAECRRVDHVGLCRVPVTKRGDGVLFRLVGAYFGGGGRVISNSRCAEAKGWHATRGRSAADGLRRRDRRHAEASRSIDPERQAGTASDICGDGSGITRRQAPSVVAMEVRVARVARERDDGRRVRRVACVARGRVDAGRSRRTVLVAASRHTTCTLRRRGSLQCRRAH